MSIDHTKLIRLNGDLDAARAQIHGLNAHHQALRDDLISIKGQVFTGMLPQHEAWHPLLTLAEVQALPAEDLSACRVDVGLVRRGAALEAAMRDVRSRINASQAEVTPLAQLVSRLNAYAEGRANG